MLDTINCSRLLLKCNGTGAETRLRLSAKRTSPFKSAGGCQFSRLLAAEACASAVVMLDTPCSEVVWRALATHCIRQFLLCFPSCASPCAITFQLESTFLLIVNGRVNLNREGGRQFSRLLAAEVCASAVVMLDTPCSEVVWRVLATHCIRQFPLHFPPLCNRVPSHFNWTLHNNVGWIYIKSSPKM